MDQKRSFVFMALSLGLLVAWLNFGPKFFPGLFPQPIKPQPVAEADADPAVDGPAQDGAPQAEADGEDATVVADAEAISPDAAADQQANQAQAAPAVDGVNLPDHPRRRIELGSLDSDTGFVQSVELTTKGASIVAISLNDDRYKSLEAPVPLRVVGNDGETVNTFQTSVELIDKQLKKFATSLADVDWEVVQDSLSESSATFRYVAPDGSLQIEKRYSLQPIPPELRDDPEVRDTRSAPYTVTLDIALKNRSPQAVTTRYSLLGPTGLPLENVEHGQKFRDVRTGFLDADGTVNSGQKDAATILEESVQGKNVEWRQPIAYLGVDTQYFAALVVPQGDQLKSSQVEFAEPVVVAEAAEPKFSDISVRLHSGPIELAAGEQVEHSYALFAGPKRESLLAPFHAGDIVDFGWFASISLGMLWLLKLFHSWHIPYGIAIIMLTMIVRGVLYPVSKKQALGAKKMKELQPKITELRQKYANDKEKLARAQMELFSKHNYNPLAGCLPIFFQLPIFIGLYRALSSSVDLRRAPFLWVDNLAAPDALFEMPFSLPFLGSDFNLLPIVTVILFIAQQKMFMPPPTDEQQALQYKMMNYMMVFFGFMFYHVPAGLCVYFIASSLWGMGERKLLDRVKTPDTPEEGSEGATDSKKKGPSSPETPKKAGLWKRLGDHLEAAAQKMDTEQKGLSSRKPPSPGGKKPKKGSRSRR